MSYRRPLVLALATLAVAGPAAFFLSGVLTSRAVQDPVISLDMVPAGNTYDETTNTMSVGPINNCLTTAPPGNPNNHLHLAHVIVQNVEDLVGWQVRVNYLGDRFRPNTVGFTPFTDNNTGQAISFVNLPIDQSTGVHRDIITAAAIPPSAPGPQTAAFGSTYLGNQNFPVSPDTPAKAVPDDSSYDAPTGGIVASFTASVLAGNAGNPSLFLNLDDGDPNGPGSAVAIFDGTQSQDVKLPSEKLGDGYHGEGATCVPLDCVNFECPGPTPTPGTPTPTASPSPTPSPMPTTPSAAGHDARLTRIGGVPKNVRLSPGEVITDSASIVVANDSTHTETIGVYVDVMAPAAGGCTPNGRVLQTTVALVAGDKTTIPIPVDYSCSNLSAANGLSYTWTAVADHGADDLSSCGPGSLQGLMCFNALANDDEDPADNRKARTGPKVVAQ